MARQRAARDAGGSRAREDRGFDVVREGDVVEALAVPIFGPLSNLSRGARGSQAFAFGERLPGIPLPERVGADRQNSGFYDAGGRRPAGADLRLEPFLRSPATYVATAARALPLWGWTAAEGLVCAQSPRDRLGEIEQAEWVALRSRRSGSHCGASSAARWIITSRASTVLSGSESATTVLLRSMTAVLSLRLHRSGVSESVLPRTRARAFLWASPRFLFMGR